MARDTRSRMIAGAARAIGTQGAAAMSLRDLAREADVPLGSTYHHFPGGKAQLVEEAVLATGAHLDRLFAETRPGGLDQTLRTIPHYFRRLLERSDFATGCPVLAVATEAEPALRDVARGVFASWQAAFAAVLVDEGVEPERAARLARLAIASFEGAVALSRAERSLAPFDEVVEQLSGMLGDVVRTSKEQR